jgi:hypothetical protein
MLSLQDMMTIFLDKIKSNSYNATLLDKPDDLAIAISRDLECDKEKAMSLLGYLLKFDYAEIDPDKGLILKK